MLMLLADAEYQSALFLDRLCCPRRRLGRNVRPTSQRRAVSPAALFLQPPTAADDDDDFVDFSHDDIFFINIFVL